MGKEKNSKKGEMASVARSGMRQEEGAGSMRSVGVLHPEWMQGGRGGGQKVTVTSVQDNSIATGNVREGRVEKKVGGGK